MPVVHENEPTFQVGPLVNLTEIIRDLGFDPGPIYAEFGYTPETFANPNRRLPLLKCSRLMARCHELTGCNELGLLLGQRAGPALLGLAGFIACASDSVGTALASLSENLDLHEDGSIVVVETNGEWSRFSYSLLTPQVAALNIIYDLCTVMMVQIMRALCGEDWNPTTVELERIEPADRKPYQAFFRSTIYFNSSRCAINFPSKHLELTPPTAEAALFEYLQQDADELHNLQTPGILKALPGVLRRGLLLEETSAQSIAAQFGLQERTFHRRLRAAGTSFRNELDLARQALSEELLNSTRLQVSDVANALGYANASGFIRAFVRWKGISPNRFRELSRNGGDAKCIN